jgi:hypothetical protein
MGMTPTTTHPVGLSMSFSDEQRLLLVDLDENRKAEISQ